VGRLKSRDSWNVIRENQTRRNFLRMMVGGLAAGAAVRTFPFRVFSFPSEIVKPSGLMLTALLNKPDPFLVRALGDFIVQPMYDYYEVSRIDQRTTMTEMFKFPRTKVNQVIVSAVESRDTGREPRITEL
jgi:hypothetical protein